MENYKDALIAIVALIKRSRAGKTSASDLSARMSLRKQKTTKLLHMLKESGLVVLEKQGGEIFASPTIEGYEKAKEWERESLPWYKRNSSSLLKIIGGSFLAALLGFLWYWLGLSPSTSLIEPLTTSNPIKIYEKQPFSSMWVVFGNAPDPDTVVKAKQGDENYDTYSKFGISPLDTPISFDGHFVRVYKIENASTSYSVIVESILVKIVSTPINDPVDLYFFSPGLGGSDFPFYEIDTSKQIPVEEVDNIKTYKASLSIDGKSYDYLSLAPGESQEVVISIKLDSPSIYELTPIVNYNYRDKNYSVATTSQTVGVPGRYRIWYSEGENLFTNKVIIDNQSGLVVLPNSRSVTNLACFPNKRWIAFESSIITYGFLEQLFLLNMESDKVFLIGEDAVHWSTDYYYSWIDSENLLMGQPFYDEKNSESLYGMKEVNVAGAISRITSKNETLNSAELGKDGYGVCFKTKKSCITTEQYYDTNNDRIVDYRDKTMLVLVTDGTKSPLWFSGETQAYPAISADENWIAFVQSNDTESSIYVMSADGSSVEKMITKPGVYQSLLWSPDGKYLAALSSEKQQPLNLFVIDINAKTETRLTSVSVGTEITEWSNDGKYIITVGDKLAITSSDGACSQIFLEFPSEVIMNAKLAP